MRHVIVEGCDGSGKTTLVELILNKRGGERGPRASTSLGGPVDHLASWVIDQEHMVEQRSPELPRLVYDRHPVISERIYGPLIRGKVTSWEFDDPRWVASRHLFIKEHFLVIWCTPLARKILRNIEQGDHMPGVKENAVPLTNLYYQRARLWTGLGMVVDPFDTDPEDILATYDLKLGV